MNKINNKLSIPTHHPNTQHLKHLKKMTKKFHNKTSRILETGNIGNTQNTQYTQYYLNIHTNKTGEPLKCESCNQPILPHQAYYIAVPTIDTERPYLIKRWHTSCPTPKNPLQFKG